MLGVADIYPVEPGGQAERGMAMDPTDSWQIPAVATFGVQMMRSVCHRPYYAIRFETMGAVPYSYPASIRASSIRADAPSSVSFPARLSQSFSAAASREGSGPALNSGNGR